MVECTFHPLTPQRWADFERLFGPHGAYGGCWCMWWRLSRAEFEKNRAEGNRRAMKRLVDGGRVPGILAYLDREPVGWCSVAPRSEFASLNRSPVLKPVDDRPVWSVVCFFVEKRYAGKGISTALIQGAQQYVASRGGQLLEAYPTVPRGRGLLPPASSFMGIQKSLRSAGFVEVARASRAKSIMRYQIPRSEEL